MDAGPMQTLVKVKEVLEVRVLLLGGWLDAYRVVVSIDVTGHAGNRHD